MITNKPQGRDYMVTRCIIIARIICIYASGTVVLDYFENERCNFKTYVVYSIKGKGRGIK